MVAYLVMDIVMSLHLSWLNTVQQCIQLVFADHITAVASNLNGNREVKYDIFKTTLKISFPTPSVLAFPNAISLYCLEKLLNPQDKAVVLLF